MRFFVLTSPLVFARHLQSCEGEIRLGRHGVPVFFDGGVLLAVLAVTLPHFYYARKIMFRILDANGQASERSYSIPELQALVDRGSITQTTLLRNSRGEKGPASGVPGLKFPKPIPKPIPITNKPLSRFTFIFLAVTLGTLGVHNFYAYRIGRGAVHMACMAPSILVFLILAITSFLAMLGIHVRIDWLPFPSHGGFDPGSIERMFGAWAFFFIVLPITSWVLAILDIIFVTEDGTGREFGRF